MNRLSVVSTENRQIQAKRKSGRQQFIEMAGFFCMLVMALLVLQQSRKVYQSQSNLVVFLFKFSFYMNFRI